MQMWSIALLVLSLAVISGQTDRMTADTPRTTADGHGFIAPAGWTVTVQGTATILEAPEGGSRIALVDVAAVDAESAVATAWEAYLPQKPWPLKVVNDAPDKDGWSRRRQFTYQTSPNERRDVSASAAFSNGRWNVAIFDLAQEVGDKRLAQILLIAGRLLPKGYTRETLAGRHAHPLDESKISALTAFVERARDVTGVPGVSLGLVQGGRVVFAGGFGAREMGKTPTVDAETLYMIASNTKALTTLLLARLVDAGKLTWETPVTTLLPSFKLGDAETTARVRVKHLICACTGLPRQDLEWLLEYRNLTPAGAMATLGTMQPTSGFGEMFQYSNPLAAAAGFVGGHVVFPTLELGAAYDRAMQEQVFDPLGMTSTTFDYATAVGRNHAFPHAPDVDGKPAPALMAVNYSIIPLRPAGGGWSSVADMLKYVQMELDRGILPGGDRYIDSGLLLDRRSPQVPIGEDGAYGMGLVVDKTYGVPLVRHGGNMIGFYSDMMWLPDHNVGAVILTNGEPGWLIRDGFARKLLEVLFDGRPEADAELSSRAKTFFEQMAADRKLLTVPADPALSTELAHTYVNDALGRITVDRRGSATVFDFDEWKSEMASRRNPDGTISFVTIAPGMSGLEFVVGAGPEHTLLTRSGQHEYRFHGR